MLKNFKRRVNRQNNNPPITGEGIQNLLNILTLFFEYLNAGLEENFSSFFVTQKGEKR